jgi:pilus assembly protein CpaB
MATMVGIAIIFGGAAIFGTDWYLKSRALSQDEQVAARLAELNAAEAEVAKGTLVVALADIPYGVELTADLLKEVAWPADTRPEGSFASIADVTASGKRVVLSTVAANSPVLLAALSGEGGRATLANTITPGMRAVTIATDEISAIAGFVAADDRVDVILTRRIEVAGQSNAEFTSDTILSDIRVVSVEQDAAARVNAAESARFVTLEVDPAGVNKLTVARELGKVSLTLRSAGDIAVEAKVRVSSTDLFATGISPEANIDAIKTTALPVSIPFNELVKPDEPANKTVIVTRGIEQQNYSVPPSE